MWAQASSWASSRRGPRPCNPWTRRSFGHPGRGGWWRRPVPALTAARTRWWFLCFCRFDGVLAAIHPGRQSGAGQGRTGTDGQGIGGGVYVESGPRRRQDQDVDFDLLTDNDNTYGVVSSPYRSMPRLPSAALERSRHQPASRRWTTSRAARRISKQGRVLRGLRAAEFGEAGVGVREDRRTPQGRRGQGGGDRDGYPWNLQRRRCTLTMRLLSGPMATQRTGAVCPLRVDLLAHAPHPAPSACYPKPPLTMRLPSRQVFLATKCLLSPITRSYADCCCGRSTDGRLGPEIHGNCRGSQGLPPCRLPSRWAWSVDRHIRQGILCDSTDRWRATELFVTARACPLPPDHGRLHLLLLARQRPGPQQLRPRSVFLLRSCFRGWRVLLLRFRLSAELLLLSSSPVPPSAPLAAPWPRPSRPPVAAPRLSACYPHSSARRSATSPRARDTTRSSASRLPPLSATFPPPNCGACSERRPKSLRCVSPPHANRPRSAASSILQLP